MTRDELFDALTIGWKGAAERILSPEEAKHRAALVWAALEEVGLQVELQWEAIELPGAQPFGVPVYLLPESAFSVHHGPEKSLAYCADGPGLNEGDLFKLARACMLRDRYMPGQPWSKKEKDRLVSHDHHLALVEELLWLGRFRAPTGVLRDQKLQPEVNDKDVDLQFVSETFHVNLEAKFRPNTWIPSVCEEFTSREAGSLFAKIDGKFPKVADGTFNLLCITGYAPADEQLTAAALGILKEHPEITGIVYWSDHAPSGRSWTYISEQSKLPETILQIDPEEALRASRVRHPVKNPKTGRPMRSPSELPDLFEALQKEADQEAGAPLRRS